jgi:hypothetical protein
LLGELLDAAVISRYHHRNPGDAELLGRADGKALDIKAASGKQTGNARQNASFVFDENGKGVFHR